MSRRMTTVHPVSSHELYIRPSSRSMSPNESIGVWLTLIHERKSDLEPPVRCCVALVQIIERSA